MKAVTGAGTIGDAATVVVKAGVGAAVIVERGLGRTSVGWLGFRCGIGV